MVKIFKEFVHLKYLKFKCIFLLFVNAVNHLKETFKGFQTIKCENDIILSNFKLFDGKVNEFLISIHFLLIS